MDGVKRWGVDDSPADVYFTLKGAVLRMRRMGEEVDLHRLTVDEALPKLDQFLNTTFQAGLHRVWVVHGKGTGVLRQEVARYLSSHPLVKSYGPADRYHGGAGATQVELSEW